MICAYLASLHWYGHWMQIRCSTASTLIRVSCSLTSLAFYLASEVKQTSRLSHKTTFYVIVILLLNDILSGCDLVRNASVWKGWNWKGACARSISVGLGQVWFVLIKHLNAWFLFVFYFIHTGYQKNQSNQFLSVCSDQCLSLLICRLCCANWTKNLIDFTTVNFLIELQIEEEINYLKKGKKNKLEY